MTRDTFSYQEAIRIVLADFLDGWTPSRDWDKSEAKLAVDWLHAYHGEAWRECTWGS